MDNNKQIFLTDEGLKALENELDELRTVKRKEIAEKIKEALAFGDLSENSEYDEAKNEQAIVESRILTIESTLKNVKIINEDEIGTHIVSVGNIVRLLDTQLKEELEYRIVGSSEADPVNGKISDESPVGKAILGKKTGNTVIVETPVGPAKYKILKISK